MTSFQLEKQTTELNLRFLTHQHQKIQIPIVGLKIWTAGVGQGIRSYKSTSRNRKQLYMLLNWMVMQSIECWNISNVYSNFKNCQILTVNSSWCKLKRLLTELHRRRGFAVETHQSWGCRSYKNALQQFNTLVWYKVGIFIKSIFSSGYFLI